MSSNSRQNPSKAHDYASYPKIYPPQGLSPVPQDSLKSTDYVHSLETTTHSVQSTKTTQSTDSLKTAQGEHSIATKAKTSTTHAPKSAQVSWCKSSVRPTLCLPPKNIYYMMSSKVLELYQVANIT